MAMRKMMKLLGWACTALVSSVAHATTPVLDVWGTLTPNSNGAAQQTYVLPQNLSGRYDVALDLSFLEASGLSDPIFFVYDDSGILNAKTWVSTDHNVISFAADSNTKYGTGVMANLTKPVSAKVNQQQYFFSASSQVFKPAPKVQFNLTVAPAVPEADTWVGMALGGMIVAAFTRRKRLAQSAHQVV
jgi:hypothetical protein